MRKVISILLSVVIVFTFAFLAIASGDDSTDDQGTKAAVDTSQDSNLGDYKVVIKDARMTQDYEGKPVIVITYNFTNNSSTDNAFYTAFSDKVFQNGVGLNAAYVLKDGDPYSADNQTKSIKPGASLDIDVAYELNDTKTDVNVEVGELISFNNTLVKKTFKIAK